MNACSILVRFDEQTSTFTAGRTISQSYYPLPEDETPPLKVAPPPGTPEGHFVFTSLHELLLEFRSWGPDAEEPSSLTFAAWEPGVLIFGERQYRGSSVYLSYVPANEFWNGANANGQSATRYFAGFKGSHPTWSRRESDAVPVVYDNPNIVSVPTGPLGAADPGTVGNMSVLYSRELGLWIMTYDGGRQPGPLRSNTLGIYLTYASAPWGPWATPQLIFNACADHGFGTFMRYYSNPSNPADNTRPTAITGSGNSAGPAGPTIGDQTTNDPDTTRGGVYAPFLVERFTEVQGDTLKIYYNMSTFNPYTIVTMESDFKITR